MSLNVLITSASGVSYALQADNIVHSFNKLPTQVALPAISGEPYVFTLDLGMGTEQFALQGIINTISSTSGDPSIIDFKTAVRTWWDYGDVPAALPKLTISSGEAYYFHFKNVELRQIAGQEDRWEASMILIIRERV